MVVSQPEAQDSHSAQLVAKAERCTQSLTNILHVQSIMNIYIYMQAAVQEGLVQ